MFCGDYIFVWVQGAKGNEGRKEGGWVEAVILGLCIVNWVRGKKGEN